jgi:hypothetical protein
MAPSLREFTKKLNTDQSYLNQFLTSESPEQFLESEAGIIISKDQVQELREMIDEYRDQFPSRTWDFSSENPDGTAIDVRIEVKGHNHF